MLRWRNWRLKYVGVQDRALKLCPAMDYPSSESERYPWKYYLVASLTVDMKSFILLFARIDRKYGLFNNVYVRFSPGPMRQIGRSDLGGNEHKHCLNGPYLRLILAKKRMNDFILASRLDTK